HQDGPGSAPALRPDARPEVGDLDGSVRLLRRRVQQLRDPPGRGQDRAGGRVRSGLPAPSRGVDPRHHEAPGEDPGVARRAGAGSAEEEEEPQGGGMTTLAPERIEERLRVGLPGAALRRQNGVAVNAHTQYLPSAQYFELTPLTLCYTYTYCHL